MLVHSGRFATEVIGVSVLKSANIKSKYQSMEIC